MKKYLLLLMIVAILPVCAWAKPKKYPIRWRYDEGLQNLSVLNVDVKIERSMMKKDMKTVYKKMTPIKVKLTCMVDWRVPNGNKNGQVLVAMFYRKGKIKYEHGRTKYTCEVENPKHKTMADSAALKPYARHVSGGVVLLIDPRSRKILATWDLEPIDIKKKEGDQDEVEYKKVLRQGDPYGMEDSFNQLPGKEVPVGHQWKRTRKQGELVYNYDFVFSKVKKYNRSKVTQIDITGEITLKGEKVGTIKGTYLHDYQYDTMVYQKVTEVIETRLPSPDTKNQEIGGIVERMQRTIETRLYKSNAPYIDKKVK